MDHSVTGQESGGCSLMLDRYYNSRKGAKCTRGRGHCHLLDRKVEFVIRIGRLWRERSPPTSRSSFVQSSLAAYGAHEFWL